jgi:uncharacterized protein YbcC (UPF0753/DUF2309 family)
MVSETVIRECVDRAATVVAPAWPIHSFVASNPLAGFEDRPFHEAVERAAHLFGGDGYPSPETFRRAWADGRIDPDRLADELADHGCEAAPETLLDRMATTDADGDEAGIATDDRPGDEATGEERVDRSLTTWLAAFFDQGRASWPMPHRERGFYAAFRAVARHDRDIPTRVVADAPDDPTAAIEQVLADVPVERWQSVFEHHLAALPGWTSLLTWHTDVDGDDWQDASPITLEEYLAVRLLLVDAFDAPVEPRDPVTTGGEAAADDVPDADDSAPSDGSIPLAERWLRAWEGTYRETLVDAVREASAERAAADTDADRPDADRPDAQLAFCLDARSERLRRHLEDAGDYETFGYAGSFGVPMRYDGYGDDGPVDACPPIVTPRHRIADRPADGRDDRRDAHDRWQSIVETGEDLLGTLGSNAATAFGFVESAGSGYGVALAARTLVPRRVRGLVGAVTDRVPSDHDVCTPSIDHDPDAGGALPQGMTLAERVEYAANAFETMGWERFASVVVFVGHGSETTNNPFGSSLDCGACAGHPGGPNARVLAAICNDDAVTAALRDRGIDVPEDTIFLAGEHDTTTDEVTLYTDDVPERHRETVDRLRADLSTARAGVASERAAAMGASGDGVAETERRAADWAETRPEWGLAGNAGLVVGPRALTEEVDLDGRVFLHSYDWRTDSDGDALAAIMTGPLVVTQWINAQYYFATVDNAVYGSGSKVTQNPVGNVGVYQGNGGDLLTGLPAQSVSDGDDPYHQPLRISTVLHAPIERVASVLEEHEDLTDCLDNGWFSLTVVDPTRDHRAFRYGTDEWHRAVDRGRATPRSVVADD